MLRLFLEVSKSLLLIDLCRTQPRETMYHAIKLCIPYLVRRLGGPLVWIHDRLDTS